MNKGQAKQLDKKLGKVTHPIDKAGGGSLDKRVDNDALQILRKQ